VLSSPWPDGAVSRTSWRLDPTELHPPDSPMVWPVARRKQPRGDPVNEVLHGRLGDPVQ
jgi:hypothetical protein